jgi:hypothetical protein|tara:strand:- start:1302 stop:1892 length:591 start_codon:yes stop_codon:yes gene_type:complete
MEDLTSLMETLDLVAKSIPEGEYLKMCHNMKNLYKVVPRATSPEAHLPRVHVRLNEPPQLARLQELTRNHNRRRREIHRHKSRLKCVHIKKRVTAGVRESAVRERCDQLGIRIREYTIDELRAKGYQIPDERSFYRGYMDRINHRAQALMDDLNGRIREMNEETDREIPEWDALYLEAYDVPRPADWFWYSQAGYV